jgi:hypothetical protein
MLTLFWDMEGVIMVRFIPKGPDLEPRDFHMFGPMKEALRGKIFSSDEDIATVQSWLQMRPKFFF